MRVIPRPRPACIAAGVLLVAGTVGCGGDDDADGSISVSDAWARPTAPTVSIGSVYMTLEAPTGDALVAVTVPGEIAARASLHSTETSSSAGTSTMRPLDELELPGGEAVSIEPGGYHLMLEELAQPLADGDSFDVTLDFSSAPDQHVHVDVTSNPPGS